MDNTVGHCHFLAHFIRNEFCDSTNGNYIYDTKRLSLIYIVSLNGGNKKVPQISDFIMDRGERETERTSILTEYSGTSVF